MIFQNLRIGLVFASALSVIALVPYPASSQDNNPTGQVCKPGTNTTYVARGRPPSRTFEPSYPYNAYVEGGWFVDKLDPDKMKQKFMVACGEDEFPVVPDVYALSVHNFGPKVVGSLCAKKPKVNFFAWPRTDLRNELEGFISTSLAQGAYLDDAFAENANKFINLPFDIEKRSKLAKQIKPLTGFDMSMTVLIEIIEKTCGALPNGIEMVVAMGEDQEKAIFRPEYLFIDAANTPKGWAFKFRNLERAREIFRAGSWAHDKFWRRKENELAEDHRKRDELIKFLTAPRSREEKFAIGAAIVVGILGAMELTSPCNNDDPYDDVLLVCQNPVYPDP
jgi:hypothetical protein